MVQYTAAAALLTTLPSLCPPTASAREAQRKPPFDRPLQTRRVVIPPSPSTQGQKKTVRCTTFAHVMVKEIDAGEVGDEQISLVAIVSGSDRPPCQAKNVANEHFIQSETWSGYFHGAKDDYVFLSAGDGVNGGLGFSVYRGADPTSLFQDAVMSERDHVRFLSVSGDAADLRLRYTRVYTAPCSVPTDGAACWARITAATHLPLSPPPDCASGYLRAKQELAKARCEIDHRSNAACIRQEIDRMKADDASPSVIGYDADVQVQPSQTSIQPAGGPVVCWPAD